MRHDRYEGIPLRDLRINEVDWTYRGEHIRSRSSRTPGDFDVDPSWATEAVMDPFRLMRATGGLSVEVVGFSNRWWGASACRANRSDQREYEKAGP